MKKIKAKYICTTFNKYLIDKQCSSVKSILMPMSFNILLNSQKGVKQNTCVFEYSVWVFLKEDLVYSFYLHYKQFCCCTCNLPLTFKCFC